MIRSLTLCIVWLMCPLGMADFVIAVGGPEIVSYSDDGQRRRQLVTDHPEDGTTPFIDERIHGLALASDGKVYSVGNSLGTYSIRSFVPGIWRDTTRFPLWQSHVWDDLYTFEGIEGFHLDISSLAPTCESPCLTSEISTGRIFFGLTADKSGNLWGYGPTDRWTFDESGNLTSTSPRVSWGVHRWSIEEGGPPTPVVDLGVDAAFGPATSPPDLEFGPGGEGYLLGTSGAIQFDPNDPGDGLGDAFLALEAGGDVGQHLSINAGWSLDTDGIFRRISRSDDGAMVLQYDPESRQTLDAIPIQQGLIQSNETIDNVFVGDSGSLLLLLRSDTYFDDPNYFRDYRLLELDGMSGQLLRATSLGSHHFYHGTPLSIFIPIPEPATCGLIWFALAVPLVRHR